MRKINSIFTVVLTCFVMLFVTNMSNAQLVSQTGETLANNTTANEQQNAAVAMDNSGRYVIVWESYDQDADQWGIYAEVYNADNSVSVPEFLVNSSTTTGSQRFPDVAMMPNGNIAIVWQSNGEGTDTWDIRTRHYTVTGTVAFNHTVSGTGSHEIHPKISAHDNGFVVVWASEVFGTDEYEIYARNYGFSTISNAAYSVSSQAGVHMNHPDVSAANSTGDYVVVWQTDSLDGDRAGLRGQLYNSSFATNGSAFNISVTTAGNQQEPAVAMDDDGDFAVVWTSYGLDGDHNGVFLQRFDAGGVAQGGETQVNETTANSQDHAAICVTEEGNYLITWTSWGQDGDRNGVYRKAMLADGTFWDGEAILNNTTAEYQMLSDVAQSQDAHDAVFAWQSGLRDGTTTNTDTDDYGVYFDAFTVADITDPVAVCQNITVYLDGSGNATITAGDVDGGSTDNIGVTSVTATPTTFDCTTTGMNVVTVTAFDAAGNSNSCLAAVTVVDSVTPVAVCQDLTVYLDGAGNATITAADVDNGSSDNCGSVALSIDVSTFDCTMTGANTVTLSATDASGNIGTCTATVTVLDTVSPTAVCQDLTVYLDGSGNASITGADLDNGSTDNCAASLIYGTDVTSFTCANIGANTVTLTVTDPGGNTSSCTSTVTVLDTVSPSAVCQNVTVYLDGTGNATITGADIDGGSSDNCGVSSVAAGTTNFSCANVGANSVLLTVTDDSGNISSCSATVTVLDTVSPTASCQDITVYLDAAGSVTVAAADIDNGSSDNCAIAAFLINGLPTQTYSCTDIGTNTVTLTVTDVNGNTATCSSTITVADTTSPIALCQDITVYLDGSGNATITGADIDGGSSDNCGVASTVASQTAFTCADIGANTVTLTVTDVNGNSSTCTSTVTIADTTSPTASCQDITVYLDGSGNATITGADIDGGSTDNCGIASVSAGTTSFTCADVGANSVVLTVTDDSGNSSTCTSTVTVADTTPPTAVCQDITLTLDGSGNASLVAADIDGGSTDNCGVASIAASQTAFTCVDAGPTTVTLTVTDVNGNSATCDAIVTITETTPPTASNPDTVYVECIADAVIDPAVVTDEADNCGTTNVTWVSDVPNGTTCPITVTRTYNVADLSGNSIDVTQIIIVNDVTPPTASNPLAINVQCASEVPAPNTGWVTDEADNCSTPTVAWVSDVSDGQSCPETITRTFSVTDDCGNSIDVEQLIIIQDVDSPVADITALPALNGYCDVTPATPTATDNCSGVVNGTADVTFPINTPGLTVVTWTYTDDCGNTSTQTQEVTIDAIEVGTWIANDNITIVSSNTASGVTYQWIDCTDGNQPLAGETNHNFTPTYSSDFAVIVTQDGCSDTSACVSVTDVGIDDLTIGNLDLILYPNPTSTGNFTVELTGTWSGEVTLELVDVRGRLIYEYTTIDPIVEVKLEELQTGTYFVQAKDENEHILTRRLVKVSL